MKTIFSRITTVIAVVVFGCGIFVLLAYAGNKSEGPLGGLFTAVNSNVASLEKKMISSRESRSNALPKKYPAVKALVFFHVSSDNTTIYKSLHWSIKNDTGIIAAIRQSLSLSRRSGC